MISTAQNTFYGNSDQPVTASANTEKTRQHRLTTAERDALLNAVREWQAAGCHVHPSRCNGSKNPVSLEGAGHGIEPDTIPEFWTNGKPRQGAGQPNPRAGQWDYGYGRIRDGQMPPLTIDEMSGWFRQGRSDGIGIFCGAPSGNLEMVEVEGRARGLLTKVRDAADRLGVRHLLDRLSHGCVSESPSAGLHFLLRVSDAPAEGSQVLAQRPDPDEPKGRLVLAETRGQGGWFVAAPSGGRTHKSGKPYRLVRGGPATIPMFTAAERDLIYQCFRAIDEMPQQQVADKPRRPARQRRDGEPQTPAADFCQRATWDDILLKKGWTKYGQQRQRKTDDGGTETMQEWTKPNRKGAKHGTTIGASFLCWTTSSPLPAFKQATKQGERSENALSKFAVYAYLNHAKPDGTPDWSAATAALREAGYGDDDELDGIQPVVVEPLPDRGEVRTLKEWQTEVAAIRAMPVAREAGFTLDRSPTGSGKTYATIQMLKAAESSLTVLPTHAGCRERIQEMRDQGIDAVAYPELTPETCQRYDDVAHAQSFGLTAGAVVCRHCPFNRVTNPRYGEKDAAGKPEKKTLKGTCHNSDRYLGQMRAADNAAHALCTDERLRLSAERVTEDRERIVIDEVPESVVAPSLSVRVEDMGIVDNLAREVLERWDAGVPSDEDERFARALRATYAAITAAAVTADAAGVVDIDIPVCEEVPESWQLMIYRWIKRLGVAELTPKGQQQFQKAMQLLTRATTGGLRSLRLIVEQTNRHKRQADGTVVESHPLHHYVEGDWLTPLAGKVCDLLDATGSADDLRDITGQDVEDITPAGYLEYKQKVVQIVFDVTKDQEAESVAGVIEDFLTNNPHVRRLGVISHQQQIREVMGDDKHPGLLPPAIRQRVHRWTYWGAGDDRASNGWHGAGNCDHLVTIGTNRRRPADLRSWLARHNLREAADLPGGDWGPRHWEAVTVDGRKIVCEGKGYRHPDWHRAATATARADLQQGGGRARAILEDGIPVTMFTDEPTGFPVDDRPGLVSSEVRETVNVIRRLVASRPLVCAISSTRDHVGGIAQTEGRMTTARAIHALMTTCKQGRGIGRRAAQIRLKNAADAGRLGKPERGWVSVLLEASDLTSDPQQAVIVQNVPADPPQVVVAPAGPGSVVDTNLPPTPALSVNVGAVAPAETTTNVCTATAVILPVAVDLSEDEPAGVTDVVATDSTALVARELPFVNATLKQLPASVRVIGPNENPFSRGWGRPLAKPVPGTCRFCKSDKWKDVSIHGGQSIRRDCARCDQFGGHVVWYGKPVAWPPVKVALPAKQPALPAGSPTPTLAVRQSRTDADVDSLSFLSPVPDIGLMVSP